MNSNWDTVLRSSATIYSLVHPEKCIHEFISIILEAGSLHTWPPVLKRLLLHIYWPNIVNY